MLGQLVLCGADHHSLGPLPYAIFDVDPMKDGKCRGRLYTHEFANGGGINDYFVRSVSLAHLVQFIFILFPCCPVDLGRRFDLIPRDKNSPISGMPTIIPYVIDTPTISIFSTASSRPIYTELYVKPPPLDAFDTGGQPC